MTAPKAAPAHGPLPDTGDPPGPGGQRSRRTPITVHGIETVPLTEDQEQRAIRALATLLAHWSQQHTEPPAHGATSGTPDGPPQPQSA